MPNFVRALNQEKSMRVCLHRYFFIFPDPPNANSRTQDPKPVFCSVLTVSGQFGCVYGVSFQIAFIKQVLISRNLDNGVSLCPVLSKVPFQHFPLRFCCLSRESSLTTSNPKNHIQGVYTVLLGALGSCALAWDLAWEDYVLIWLLVATTLNPKPYGYCLQLPSKTVRKISNYTYRSFSKSRLK